LTLLKTVPVVVLAVAAATMQAQSRSLYVSGTAGYLSEWEMGGEVADTQPGGGEFIGRLVWKHVGVCSVNGPQERPGHIRIRLSGPSKVDATISFDGDHCTYTGPASGTGRMDCRNAGGGIPISISIK
jgi:hypothetical protein